MKYLHTMFIGIMGMVLISCSSPKPAAKISLPPLFTDHMVLQQGMAVPVWGTANPDGLVQVEFKDQKVSTAADSEGKWQVQLKAQDAGGPFKMKIIGADTLVIRDILVGEVWLGSGQSNMEMPLAGWGKVLNYEQEINDADYPNIRLFQAERNMSLTPLDKINSDGWKVCTPENIPEFSSTAYFFGRKLHKDLNVPVGLIHSSWGGTIIEAWMSAASLEPMPEFRNKIIKIKNMVKDFETKHPGIPHADMFELIKKQWMDEIEQKDRGFNSEGAAWNSADLDMTGWETMQLPSTWEEKGLAGLDGIVWFRKEVELPSSWAGREITLNLSAVDDIDSTYFNGEFAGSNNIWDAPREYVIQKHLVKAGKNVIAVRVQDNQGGGGIWGNPDLLKLVLNKKSEISLTGEWKYKIGLDFDEMNTPGLRPDNPNYPTILSNAMIDPLVPYAVKGVIWYQGESNADRAAQYRRLFPAMIKDWRRRWGQGEFPFLFVQLANFMEKKAVPADDSWAELRDAQLMTLNELNTGMAVAIDIGDADDIHPKNKQEVGRRLALNALKIAYQRNLVFSGPIYSGMKIENSRIRLSFEHAAEGLKTADNKNLSGFAIAGKDRKFVWADAEIQGSEIVVSSADVKEPAAVRYNWESNPSGRLINSAGLPASPFRTDNWPGITADK